MSKNFFHRLKESLSYSNKSKDFERAKEVLFSSKTPKQLASAVNYINNFNKKHGITKDSPEFIYFDKMILAMKLKIKNRKGGISEEMDDSSRFNRIIKNIIKESFDDLSWIEDIHSSFDPHFIFKGKEHWVNVEGLSDEEKLLIREYLLGVTNYRSTREFRKNRIDRYKGFVVHCGSDTTNFIPEEDQICYMELSFDEDEYKDDSIYVDGREVLEYINLTDHGKKMDESLEWSDKDNSYGNDEKYSADTSWKTDDNWTPNPDKSYWKQGSTGTGGGESSDGGDVNEEEDILGDEDEFDWIKQIEEFPNYNGFPQGVVYVDNHQEIDLFYELLQKINPKDFVGRGDINRLHQGLESMRDEVEAEGYDSSEAILSISFFVEKDYPGGLSFGYWSYDVDEGGIYDWLKYDDTFNREYKLYNCVYDLEKDVKNLIN
jgi:hypothetical protein